MGSLFISHSSDDDAAASELRDRLAAAGYHATFLDVDPRTGLVGGQRWEEQLYRQLRVCDALVFLATPSSVTSPWCFAEIALARSIGKPVIPLGRTPGIELSLIADTQMIHAATDDERWAMLLRSLRSLGVTPDLSFEWDHDRNPYPGLEAFQPDDAGVFFGRDADISTVLGRMRPSMDRTPAQAVTVVGPSGSGKSSLVRAGLVARLLRATEFHVPPPMNPGTAPVAALAGALATGWPGGPPGSRTQLAAWINGGADAALAEYVASRMDELRGNRRLVLVVDQLEEMLQSDVGAQRRFLAALAAVQAAPVPVTVVLTVRSHFLEACQLVAPSGFLSHLLGVTALDRARLAAAIRRPAEVVGVQIADEVVDAVLTEAGAGDLLPLMAYTMRTLYEDLVRDGGRVVTLSRYERLGGVIATMSRQADRAFELAERAHGLDVVRRTLLKLVAVGPDREPVRRQARLSTMDPPERGVIGTFVDARLLSVDSEGSVGVTHEALLRRWAPLVAAIDDATDDLLVRTEVESATRRWDAAGRSPGRLLSADRLDEALRWARENPFDLDDLPDLVEFLRACQETRKDVLARRAAAVAEHVLSGYPADLPRQEAIMSELAETFPELGAVEMAARAVRDRDLCRSRTVLPGVTTGPLVVSRSGTAVATATLAGEVIVVDLISLRPDGVVPIGAEPPVAIALLGTTRQLACARENVIEIYDWRTGHLQHRIDHPGRVVAMCGNGADRLISADELGSLRAWSAEGHLTWHHDVPDLDVREVAHGGDVIAVLDGSGELTLIAPDGTTRPGPPLHQPVSGLVAVADTRFTLFEATDPPSESNRFTTFEPDGPVSRYSWTRRIAAASIAADVDTYLVAMSDGSAFLITDLNDDEDVTEELTGHQESPRAATWAASLNTFLTAGVTELMVWRTPSPALLTARLPRGVRGLCWSHDGSTLASVGGDGGVGLWRLDDTRLELVGSMVGHHDLTSAPVWSFDDAWIATLYPDAVVLWPLYTDEEAIQIPLETAPIGCAFSGPEGSLLVVAFEDAPAGVWAWRTGADLPPVPASAGLTRVTGGPTGFSGIDPGGTGVLVWHDPSSQPEHRCDGYSVLDVAVVADDRMLAVTTDGRLLVVSADGDVESATEGEPFSGLGWWAGGELAAGIDAEGGLVVRGATKRTTFSGTWYTAAAVRADGVVAAGDAAGWIAVASMTAGDTSLTELGSVPAHTAAVGDVRWSGDDSAVIAVTGFVARVHPLHAFDQPVTIDTIRGQRITGLVTQPDGTLVVALGDGSLLGYHPPDGPTVFELPPSTVQDPLFACCPGGGFLSAEPDGRVRSWSADGLERGAVATGIGPQSLSTASVDRWVLLGADGTVVLGTTVFGAETHPLTTWSCDTHSPAVAISLSVDGRWVALTDGEGLAILASTGPDAGLPPLRVEGAACAAWSPDARLLAIGFDDGGVEVRIVESWQVVHRIPGPERVTCLAWSNDSRLLAGGTVGGRLVVVEHLSMGEVTEWLRTRVTEPVTAEERDRYGIPATLVER